MVELGAVVLAAGVAGVACLGVPQLIASVPEPPADEPDDLDQPDEPPKEAYAEIAARPGLSQASAVVGGAAGALVGWAVGWAWGLVVVLPVLPICVALSVIDWRTRLLPTRLIAPAYGLVAIGIGVATVVSRDLDDLVRAGVGWAALGGTFVLLWLIHPRGMGFGDVRLSGVLGLGLGYLGWGELVLGGYAGFLLGAVVGGVLTLLKILDRKGYPFGPFLLAGALTGVVFGGPFWELMSGSR